MPVPVHGAGAAKVAVEVAAFHKVGKGCLGGDWGTPVDGLPDGPHRWKERLGHNHEAQAQSRREALGK